MQVFDNVIPTSYQDAIADDLMSLSFPWHYIDDVTNHNVNYENNSGLVHLAYNHDNQHSEWLSFLKPLLYSVSDAAGIPVTQLFRIRVGMLLKTDNLLYQYNRPHVDFVWPHYTACYYVNDSDGDTVVFDQNLNNVSNHDDHSIQNYVSSTEFTVAGRASPQKGRVCLFNGANFHSSTKPKLHDRRVVITMNFI